MGKPTWFRPEAVEGLVQLDIYSRQYGTPPASELFTAADIRRLGFYRYAVKEGLYSDSASAEVPSVRRVGPSKSAARGRG